jgi:hypothetical protein
MSRIDNAARAAKHPRPDPDYRQLPVAILTQISNIGPVTMDR